MSQIVKSVFSICSPKFGVDYLSEVFPWRVVEAVSPNEKMDAYITAFDLEVGQHERADKHLAAVKRVLLAHEADLNAISRDCSYALWVDFTFEASDGALNLPANILAAFGMLNIEIIVNLKPTACANME